MKKAFLAAGLVVTLAGTVSAQTKKKLPPPPPEPPKPPVEMVNIAPPPPPPPAPVPPPPPPPPVVVLSKKEIAALPEDHRNFYKRNPSVGSLHWEEDAVLVVLKKGDTERYPLDENGIKQVEAKYGKLPTAPPPPPRMPETPLKD